MRQIIAAGDSDYADKLNIVHVTNPSKKMGYFCFHY